MNEEASDYKEAKLNMWRDREDMSLQNSVQNRESVIFKEGILEKIRINKKITWEATMSAMPATISLLETSWVPPSPENKLDIPTKAIPTWKKYLITNQPPGLDSTPCHNFICMSQFQI